MKISRLDESPADFHLLDSSARLQTATMLLRYGEATGGKASVHQHSDQMLLLISGSLKAEIGSEELVLKAGESLIVPAGVKHRFHNAEREAALAFTVYSPPRVSWRWGLKGAAPHAHGFSNTAEKVTGSDCPARSGRGSAGSPRCGFAVY